MALEIKDILVTIRQYINLETDGLEVSYKECDARQQEGFIEACKYLILHGFDENFKDSNTSEDDFFSQKIIPILTSPKNTLFLTNPNVGIEDEASIRIFIRYTMLRSLFDMVSENKIITNLHEKQDFQQWFFNAKNKLDAEFKDMYNRKFIIRYMGVVHEVDGIKGMNELLRKKEMELKNRFSNGVIVAGYSAISLGAIFIASLYFKKTFIILAMAVLSAARGFYMYNTERLTNIHQFFKNKVIQGFNVVIPDNAKKHIFLSDDEINMLGSNADTNQQLTNGLRIRNTMRL